MIYRFDVAIAALVACGALLSIAPPVPVQAAAADLPDTAEAKLEEIIVTARKRKEDLQTVPVSITALSGDELKEQSVTQISDLQGQVPSVYFQQGNDDPQSIQFTIRGRKQNDIILSVDPSVGLNVDGVSVPRTLGMRGSLLDLDRVEVLRGPQGTLYGRNSTSGAVSLYTNDPTNQLSGSLDLTGGNFDAANLVGIVNIPITDNLAARFVAQRGTHDGYGHNLVGGPLGSEDSQYYRAKFRATFAGDWQAILSMHYESNHSGGALFNLVGLSPSGARGLPEGGLLTLEAEAETGLSEAQSIALLRSYVAKSRSDFYNNGSIWPNSSNVMRADTALNISGSLSDTMTFRSITGFQRLIRREAFASPIPVVAYNSTIPADDNYLSQEFQILGSTPGLDWVAGLYGGHEKGHDDFSVWFLPFIFGADPRNPDPSALFSPLNVQAQRVADINSTAAGFAQATWEFVDDWHLTGGARYTHDSRRSDVAQYSDGLCQVPAPGVEFTDGTPATGPSQCPRTFENSYGKASWLASIDHQLTPDTLVYVKAATGYRSGGENVGGGGEIETFNSFAPETNLEYELGIKTSALDQKLRLNMDVYHDKYTNMQVNTNFIAADGQFANVVASAAKGTIEGVEAEADAIINTSFRIHMSTAYTDAHYDSFYDARYGDRSHEAFTVPKWTYSVSGRYTRPTELGQIFVQVEYDWKSSIVLAPTASILVPGHPELIDQVTQGSVGLLNGRANLHLRSWDMDIALFGKNITGKQYYDDASAQLRSGFSFAYPAAPRTYGIEIIKKFGP
jgi:iron complex outermembrane receptor protein